MESPAEERILSLLRQRSRISSPELVRALGMSRQAVHKHLQALEEKNLIEQHGAARSTYYTEKDARAVRSSTSDPSQEPSAATSSADSSIQIALEDLPPAVQRAVLQSLQQSTRRTSLFPRSTRKVIKVFGSTASLSSRFEARRLLDRFGDAKELMIDFDRVETLGTGFADEIFRVWACAHPDAALFPVNMTPAVARIVNAIRDPQG